MALARKTIQWVDIASFPPLLAQLGVCDRARQFVNKCFFVIFNELCEALNIDAIVVDDELAAIVAPRAAATAEGVDTLEHWALECEDSAAAIFSLVHTDKLRAEGANSAKVVPCCVSSRTWPVAPRPWMRGHWCVEASGR